ncbi:hypothetical protein MMC34_001856 [Xylographa carneopallida]|nr:hypothetical protein [Xylographa carneopallida]
MPPASPPLSSLLPPLICGTATFNSQYNPDPYTLPTTGIVHRALSLGVRAFDTSPYYGPAEDLLGQALDTCFVHDNFPRRDYYILTKVGRVGGAEFDYSPAWVRTSIQQSLKRLKTEYLDVVYCHDVEFVTPEEVLAAVTELRRIRGENGAVKYVGISGYPVVVLCELAEMILEKTGEPLDIVMSYANYTLQNTRLSSVALPRLKAAGVDVVPNASVLAMGLLRRGGVPVGSLGDWHPSPNDLRSAVENASRYCDEQGDRIEKVAIRWALETWLKEGATVGSRGDLTSRISGKSTALEDAEKSRHGISVIGVSNLEELDETMHVWRSILDGLKDREPKAAATDADSPERAWSLQRQKEVRDRAAGVQELIGSWLDYAWPSPGPDFANKRSQHLAFPAPLPTPAVSPKQTAFRTSGDDGVGASSRI